MNFNELFYYNKFNNLSYNNDEQNYYSLSFDIENQINNEYINSFNNYLTYNIVDNNNKSYFKEKIIKIIFEKINNLIKKN